MKRTIAWAPSNIALVKYWGKRDEKLMLPTTDSFSMTLSNLGTETEILSSIEDEFFLGGQEFVLGQQEYDRVFDVVRIFRKNSELQKNIRIVSKNNFPTAAGLASSASGMSALVFALDAYFDTHLSLMELSRIARSGSGSATRSFWGGFVKWSKGEREDGSDSVGEQMFDEFHWPDLRLIINIVSGSQKEVSSREGMKRTVSTSSLYKNRFLPENDHNVVKAIEAVRLKDLSRLGPIVEDNALLMHETMRDSKPPFSYLTAHSRELISYVAHLREAGISVYVTVDAGPQIKILCLEKDVAKILLGLESKKYIINTIVCKPGAGPRIVEEAFD